MAIPESLARQDYWYRTTFDAPAGAPESATDADLQGHQLRRRSLDERRRAWDDQRRVHSRHLRCHESARSPASKNVIAVRVSPPPASRHSARRVDRRRPGRERRQSRHRRPHIRRFAKAGTGFPASAIATPASGSPSSCGRPVRSSSSTRTSSPTLPLPRTDRGEVSITVPRREPPHHRNAATVEARFEGVTVRKPPQLPPGTKSLSRASSRSSACTTHACGGPTATASPELYTLTLTVS